MDAYFYIWLAGFVDGEGCITFRRNRENGTVYPSLCVVNTCESVVRYIRDITGVGHVCRRRVDPNPKHRPVYEWHVDKRDDVIKLCLTLKPYLKVKHLQVEVILNWNADLYKYNEIGTAAVLFDNDRYFNDMRQLNTKGGRTICLG